MPGPERFDWQAAHARLRELELLLEQSHAPLEVERVLAERAERYRVLERQDTREGRSMIVFVRAGQSYAIPLESISEIRIGDRITALPGISPVIKGIVNVRGRMTAVHDIGSFAKPVEELPATPWLLIGYATIESSAWLADDVEGIQRIFAGEVRPMPLSLTHKGPGFVGVGEDNLIILDPLELFASPEFLFA